MATGRDPSQSELQILTGAQRTAATWCGHIVSRLEPVVRFALGGGDGCGQGVPNIRTFRQASGNAYCYDLFAFCMSREP